MSTPAPYNQPQDAVTPRWASKCWAHRQSFGSFPALDNVSIKLAPGTIHALLGENGAGKSTLVKCIMGYACRRRADRRRTDAR